MEENHVMEGKVDSKNDLTVVIDAYTGDKGSSPDSSTTKSESSFKMVTCKLFCLEESRECGTKTTVYVAMKRESSINFPTLVSPQCLRYHTTDIN